MECRCPGSEARLWGICEDTRCSSGAALSMPCRLSCIGYTDGNEEVDADRALGPQLVPAKQVVGSSPSGSNSPEGVKGFCTTAAAGTHTSVVLTKLLPLQRKLSPHFTEEEMQAQKG